MRTPRLVLALTLLVPALCSAVDFDAGPDAAAFLAEAKDAAEKVSDPAPKYRTRYERDCVAFRFGPDSSDVSETVWLRSTEYREECWQTGDPRHGGRVECRERAYRTYRERARVALSGRQPLLPWEHDVFEVCLEGPWVNARQFESAYEYRRVDGGRGADMTVAPVKKTPMRPDPTGVRAEISPRLTVVFLDKWASYYAGERIVLKLTLKKHVPNWFDPTLMEKEVELPVAASYALELGAETDSMDSRPEPGKSYYVEYSIKRVGAVSRPVFTKTLESNKAAYAPAEALARN